MTRTWVTAVPPLSLTLAFSGRVIAPPVPTSSRRMSLERALTTVAALFEPRFVLTLSNVSSTLPPRDTVTLNVSSAASPGSPNLDADVITRGPALGGGDPVHRAAGLLPRGQLPSRTGLLPSAIRADAHHVCRPATVEEVPVDRVREIRALDEVTEHGVELSPVGDQGRRIGRTLLGEADERGNRGADPLDRFRARRHLLDVNARRQIRWHAQSPHGWNTWFDRESHSACDVHEVRKGNPQGRHDCPKVQRWLPLRRPLPPLRHQGVHRSLGVMIADVDASLRSLLRATALHNSKVEVVFDSPTRAWADTVAGDVVDAYLWEIREDVARSRGDWEDVRDDQGRVTGRRPPLHHYRLRYLVTAWGKTPVAEHQLLSSILGALADEQTIPAEHITGELASEGRPVFLSVALPPEAAGGLPVGSLGSARGRAPASARPRGDRTPSTPRRTPCRAAGARPPHQCRRARGHAGARSDGARRRACALDTRAPFGRMTVVVTRRASATHERATGHNIRAVQDDA